MHTGSIEIFRILLRLIYLALKNPPFVCFCSHLCVFFRWIILDSQFGEWKKHLTKKTSHKLFLLCMDWWKPHSIFGRCNVFLEINSRFGYSCVFIVVLIILDIKCSWRGSQVGCEKISFFLDRGRYQLYYKKNTEMICVSELHKRVKYFIFEKK